MKLYLDTGDTKLIRIASLSGVIDGVTTNPTLIGQSGREFQQVITEIAEINIGPVSAEVTSNTVSEMVAEGIRYASWHPNVVVKVPMTEVGLAVVKELSTQGVKTNVTLIFNLLQGLLAAKAGATYISPFVGRLVDQGADGIQLVADLRQLLDNYAFETEIIAASLRTPQQVQGVLQKGADIATIPVGLLKTLFNHPLTTAGLARFQKDWDNYLRQQKEATQ